MARTRHSAKAFALAAITVPLLSAGLAGAAVTSPTLNDSWYSGTTHTITWEAESGSDVTPTGEVHVAVTSATRSRSSPTTCRP